MRLFMMSRTLHPGVRERQGPQLGLRMEEQQGEGMPLSLQKPWVASPSTAGHSLSPRLQGQEKQREGESQSTKGRGDKFQGRETDKPLFFVTACGPTTLGHTHTHTHVHAHTQFWIPDPLLSPVEKVGSFSCIWVPLVWSACDTHQGWLPQERSPRAGSCDRIV